MGLLDFVEDIAEDVGDFLEDPVDFIQEGIQGILGLDIDQPGAQKRAEGALITKVGATESIPLVYGERRVGGIFIYAEVTGTKNRDLWLVYALADGDAPIIDVPNDSFNQIFIDDVPANDAKFSGLIQRQFTLGDHTTQPFPLLETESDSKWTANHKLLGVAAIAIRLRWDPSVFSGLPRISFFIEGTGLLDLDVLPTETRRYSRNPAEVLFDYLVNDIVGKGLSKTDGVDIDLQSFKDSRDYCDELISSYSGGPTHKRFSCDVVLNTDPGIEIMDNVESILQTCRGSLPFINGRYHLRIEKHYTPADYGRVSYFDFNVDNIIGGWSFKSGDINNRYNRVKVTFPNEDKDFKSDFVVVESATFRAEDGRTLEKTIALTGTTNVYRALDFASVVLRRSRNQLSVSFISNQEGRLVTAGTIVTVTHPTPAWTAEQFRVTRIQLLKSGNCGISLARHDATVYDLSVPNEAITTLSTNLPDPSVVPAITGLVLVSDETVLSIAADGTLVPRIQATWTESDNIFVDGYNVEFKKSSESIWLPAGSPTSASATEVSIPNVEEGVDYDVRVRAKNSGGFFGSWFSDLNHTVIGKTSLPADVSSLAVFQQGNLEVFKWTRVLDRDLSGYDIKYGPASTATWLSATTLTEVTKGTNVTTADVPPGDWKFFIKAVDTSGNESLTAAEFVLSITNQSSIVSAQEESPLWSGTAIGLLSHWTGALVVDSTDSASGDNFDVFDNYNIAPVSIASYETLEKDIDFDDTVRLWSSVDQTPGAGEPTAGAPSIQLDYKENAGSYDGFEEWSISQARLQQFKTKVTLDTTLGVPFISGFQTTVDKDPSEQSAAITVAPGGSTVIFPNPYHNVPIVTPIVIGASALIPAVNNITATGFDIHFFNTSGVDVGGNGSWTSLGV